MGGAVVGRVGEAPEGEQRDPDPPADAGDRHHDEHEGAGDALASLDTCRHQPPIGALGFAPQNTSVPIIPMMCTRTTLRTIDFAVAVPTPTGPPDAV